MAKGPALTLAELNRATLARQMLLERAGASPLQAVEQLCGLQAQLARPPFVALWSRLASFARGDLAALALGRQVVRGTFYRGTLHLVSSTDYVRFRPVLQPLLDGGLVHVKDHLAELQLDATLQAARALLDERPRAFDEIRTALVDQGLPGNERAMGLAVRMLMPLVQLPSDAAWGWDGKAPFAAAETWLGRSIQADEAGLPALVLRYLAAFGPASVADAGAWSGMKGLRSVFDALRPRLLTFQDPAGRELFDLPDAPRPPADTPVPARFLPEFDSVVLGHDDRGRFMDREHRARVVSKNLQVAATFLLDGRVAGTWKVERRRRVATLLLQPFRPLSRREVKALEAEALPLLEFIEPDAADRAFQVAE